MDGKTLQAELGKVIKLNEELSRTNTRLTSDLDSLVDATKALQEDRDRRTKEQRELRQRVEELEAINPTTRLVRSVRLVPQSFDD